MRRLEHRLGQTELCRDEGYRRPEAAPQGAGDDLSPGTLPRRAGRELADRAAARSRNHDERRGTRSDFGVRENPGPAADPGHRRIPVRPTDAAPRPDDTMP